MFVAGFSFIQSIDFIEYKKIIFYIFSSIRGRLGVTVLVTGTIGNGKINENKIQMIFQVDFSFS